MLFFGEDFNTYKVFGVAAICLGLLLLGFGAK
jgi:multidrug transporter EmrE-like cation transporter